MERQRIKYCIICFVKYSLCSAAALGTVVLAILFRHSWRLFLKNNLLALLWAIPSALVPTGILWLLLLAVHTGRRWKYSYDLGKTWVVGEPATAGDAVRDRLKLTFVTLYLVLFCIVILLYLVLAQISTFYHAETFRVDLWYARI